MANKRFLMAILAMALVLGMAVVSCDNGSLGGTDSALNGTWVGNGQELILNNNGSFEWSINGTKLIKGTYTGNNNRMTMTTTDIWGGNPLYPWALEPRWYSRNQLKTALGAAITDPELNERFRSYAGTYTVTGNTLDLSLEVLGSGTYTR